jgi:hypothetical protein
MASLLDPLFNVMLIVAVAMVKRFIWVYSAIYLPRWASPSLAAADLRAELIPAERQYIYQLLQDGKITDEGCHVSNPNSIWRKQVFVARGKAA